MALIDEEEYSLGGLQGLEGLSNLEGLDGLSNLDLGAFGTGKKNDPLATSWDNFKIQFGGETRPN